MNCQCSALPHELWCPEAPECLTVEDVRTNLMNAPCDGSKRFVVDVGGGRYLPVERLAVEFYRGAFVAVAKVAR